MSTLEQSMKAAIETLAQLDQLKAEVVELTATRDSLREITAKLEQAEADWLKTIEKTNNLREQVNDEISAIKSKAVSEANDKASKIVNEAEEKALQTLNAAADQVAVAKNEYADLRGQIADAKVELDRLTGIASETAKQHDEMLAEISRVKKVIASL